MRALRVIPDMPSFEAETLIEIAEVFLKRREGDRAIDQLSRVLEIAGEITNGEFIYRAHEGMSQAYELKGELSEALAHYKAFFKWREAVLGEQADKKVKSVLIQAAVEQSQKEAEIYRLRNVELATAHKALQAANEENSRLIERLREQATELERQSREDGLTGLSNRRYLDIQFAHELDRARRYGHDLSVCLADIDFFKKINDQFSHQTGDEVLKRVARILKDGCRTIDVVSRYGGEEFALVLVETPVGDAVGVCERIRRSVEAYDWREVDPSLRVTISMGVAGNKRLALAQELLAAADKKLYEAKANGRNQVRS